MAKITVVGSFVMDMVATMDRFPTEGESLIGTSIAYYPGGKGINQCISIARLGGDVEMCGMVGRDNNGEIFLRILEEDGVEHRHVYTCDKPTAVAQIQINKEGQNRICIIPSANYAFSLKEVDAIKEVLKNTELLVLQMELTLEVTIALIRLANELGVKILLNPAPAAKLPDEVLAKVDYLTPNETELSILSGMPCNTLEEISAACDKLLKLGVKTLISTLGSRGAMIATEKFKETIPGYSVKTVDTVAAGDSFNGAFAVALTEGKSLVDCVKFANAMGALTVQKKGAIPSIHTRKEVEEFMRLQARG